MVFGARGMLKQKHVSCSGKWTTNDLLAKEQLLPLGMQTSKARKHSRHCALYDYWRLDLFTTCVAAKGAPSPAAVDTFTVNTYSGRPTASRTPLFAEASVSISKTRSGGSRPPVCFQCVWQQPATLGTNGFRSVVLDVAGYISAPLWL